MTDNDYRKTSTELKETAIAIISSSVAARALDTVDDRIKQYGSDFSFLVGDLTMQDFVRMTSLIADMTGFLVETLAQNLEMDSEKVMQELAQKMLTIDVEEDEI